MFSEVEIRPELFAGYLEKIYLMYETINYGLGVTRILRSGIRYS